MKDKLFVIGALIVLFACQNRVGDSTFKYFFNPHNNILIQDYCDSIIHLKEPTTPYMFLMTAEVIHSDTLFSMCTVPYPVLFEDKDHNVKQFFTEYKNTVFLISAISIDTSSILSIDNLNNETIEHKVKEDALSEFPRDNLKRDNYQLFILSNGTLIPTERQYNNGFVSDTDLELSDELFE